MMTEKQKIRYNELESLLIQLKDDVERIHWKDLDQDTKNKLSARFDECLNRMRTSLMSGNKEAA